MKRFILAVLLAGLAWSMFGTADAKELGRRKIRKPRPRPNIIRVIRR